jgi:hypothetical protein
MTTTEANIQFTIAAAKSAADNGDWSTLEEIVANAFSIERKDSRAAAYEDAAKIADSKLKYDPHPHAEAMAAHIAIAIRAKAKEITG